MRLEKPVPKSSMAMRTPRSFRACRVKMARSAFASNTVSVISSSSSSAGSWASVRLLRTNSTKLARWNCTGEIFTAITASLKP
ncbi:hypothetical protein D9M68_724520 [compost metagenome]